MIQLLRRGNLLPNVSSNLTKIDLSRIVPIGSKLFCVSCHIFKSENVDEPKPIYIEGNKTPMFLLQLVGQRAV